MCLELPTGRFLVQFGFLDTHTREWVPISPWNFISLESRDRETVHFFLALLLPALPHRLLAGLIQLKRGSQSPVAVDVIDDVNDERRYNLSSLSYFIPHQSSIDRRRLTTLRCLLFLLLLYVRCPVMGLFTVSQTEKEKREKQEKINVKNSCGNDSHSAMYVTVSFPQNIQNHSGKSVATAIRDICFHFTIHGVMSFSTADYPSIIPNTVSLVTQFLKKQTNNNNNKRIGRREERSRMKKTSWLSPLTSVGWEELGVLERKSNSHCYYSNRNPIDVAWLFLVFDRSD